MKLPIELIILIKEYIYGIPYEKITPYMHEIGFKTSSDGMHGYYKCLAKTDGETTIGYYHFGVPFGCWKILNKDGKLIETCKYVKGKPTDFKNWNNKGKRIKIKHPYAAVILDFNYIPKQENIFKRLYRSFRQKYF